MTAVAYVPQVGDRVKRYGDAGVVLATHPRSGTCWVDFEGVGPCTSFAADLVKLPTFPERWINVYADPSRLSAGHRSRRDADHESDHARIGIIHLHSDGTVEMVQP